MKTTFKQFFLLLALLSNMGLITACSTNGGIMRTEALPTNSYLSGDINNKGYKYPEAAQFIEFCVELDSQDDRSTPQGKANPNFVANIDPEKWNPKPVFDSRAAVARDLIAYRTTGDTDANKGWVKLYKEIIARMKKNNEKPFSEWTEQEISDNPNYNGFGPYQSAWLLYEGVGDNLGSYAIAIRGTVFTNSPSAVEDALFHPVIARHFLSEKVSFSSFGGASVHSGFAHATFSLLLDEKYGILNQITQVVGPNSKLYIVGHSQGASMATLVHSFFHYSMANAHTDTNVFNLDNKNYRLKSYAFAQPKPGNFAFSADFSSITQQFDNAIVINNDIDPVPQVPFTLEDFSDLNGDLPSESIGGKVIRTLGGIGGAFRGFVGRAAEPIVRKDDAGFGYYFNYSKLGRIGEDKIATSWNFVPAGHVLLVYGNPGDANDQFLQHHAFTYRNLIASQLH